MTPEQITAYVDACAPALGLQLTPEQRPGVARFFALAKGFADLLDTVPLAPHDESAMSFVPVEPGSATTPARKDAA
jgi:hypothetical protein